MVTVAQGRGGEAHGHCQVRRRGGGGVRVCCVPANPQTCTAEHPGCTLALQHQPDGSAVPPDALSQLQSQQL
eukprot:361051-Chlamydomonas_euryale.AAC.2